MCSKCGGAAKHWRCFVPSRAQGRLTNDEVAKQIDHAIAGVVFLGLLVGANLGLAAGDTGTAAEAKAMLERAVAAIETDEAAALAAFTAGDEGFKDRTSTCSAGMPPTAVSPHTARIRPWSGRACATSRTRPASRSARSSTVAAEGEYNAVEYVAAPGRDRAFAENVVHHQSRRPGLRCGYYK